MYRHVFINSPFMVAALDELGIRAVLDAFKTSPRIHGWIASGEADSNVIDEMDKEIERRSRDTALTPGRLYEVFGGLYDETDWSVSPERASTQDTKIRLVVAYLNCVSEIDVGDADTASALGAGHVDWDSLVEAYYAHREADPTYVAFQLIRRMGSLDEAVGAILMKILPRIVRKELKNDADWCSGLYERDFLHVRDWVASAVVNRAPWLAITDEGGCPRKLAKCGTLAALVREADKQMKKDFGGRRTSVECGDVKFASEGGPYELVRMTTPEGLDYESERMRHCIGHGAYDSRLGDDDRIFLSLRDDAGRPHATLEIVGKYVTQFHGKANSRPKPEYSQAVEDMLMPLGIAMRRPAPEIGNACREISAEDVRIYDRLIAAYNEGSATLDQASPLRFERSEPGVMYF